MTTENTTSAETGYGHFEENLMVKAEARLMDDSIICHIATVEAMTEIFRRIANKAGDRAKGICLPVILSSPGMD